MRRRPRCTGSGVGLCTGCCNIGCCINGMLQDRQRCPDFRLCDSFRHWFGGGLGDSTGHWTGRLTSFPIFTGHWTGRPFSIFTGDWTGRLRVSRTGHFLPAPPLLQHCCVQQPPRQLCCLSCRGLLVLSALESSLLLLPTMPVDSATASVSDVSSLLLLPRMTVVSAKASASEGCLPHILEALAMPSIPGELEGNS